MPDTMIYVAGAVVTMGTMYTFRGPIKDKLSSILGRRFSDGNKALRGRAIAVDFKLVEKKKVTHDTNLFRFSLEKPDQVLGMPIGNCLLLSADIPHHGTTTRPYTPVSSPNIKGYFDLVVKIYRPNEQFPNGGKMTQFLDSLQVGSVISGRGPMGGLEYTCKSGLFDIRQGFGPRATVNKLAVKKLGLIAGGSGITPMFQLIRAILENSSDEEEPLEIRLLFANKTMDDLILKDELDDFARRFPSRFKVHYLISEKPGTVPKGPYSFGIINEQFIKEWIPAPADDCLVAVCGPPGMVKQACVPNLEAIGHQKDHIHVF